MQKVLSIKNSIEIWLLQIGEQFINKKWQWNFCRVEILLTTLEKNAPKLICKIKKPASDKPWVTKEIKQLVSEKHRCFNLYKSTKSAEPFVSFKIYRNFVNRKLKEHKNQFSENFLRKLKPQNINGNSLKKLETKITVQTSLKLTIQDKKRKTKSQSITLLTEFLSK